MNPASLARLHVSALALTVAAVLSASSIGQAQAPAGTPTGLAQRYAPIDLTGTWVSVVTEDWAVRMIPPPKGDFESLPLTRAAQEAANRVDMTQVAAAGRACEAYGAPAIMREPGRVRISWQDASTLKLETDAGEQTRLFHFDRSTSAAGPPGLQGLSLAAWQYANGFDPIRAADAAATPAPAGGRGGRGGGGRGAAVANAPSGGRLKVVTTNLTPGFLRKNGVPYSANTVVTEYFNLLTEPSGQQWFVVTTIVHDPVNLVVDYITSTNFRKEPDGAKFRPQPCSLR
jgi:hypothetical protein